MLHCSDGNNGRLSLWRRYFWACFEPFWFKTCSKISSPQWWPTVIAQLFQPLHCHICFHLQDLWLQIFLTSFSNINSYHYSIYYIIIIAFKGFDSPLPWNIWLLTYKFNIFFFNTRSINLFKNWYIKSLKNFCCCKLL